ncbi:hypothetical protein TrCOL_g9435 [Triparma columacea]|uniref:J domain-containing protein n=1 Tax=Triparma columacea TaxID=722753 RepID=A0A9W7FZF8_9STRA|nr:hypothetical protein TrCOL_g9435 [Triparma columacea]
MKSHLFVLYSVHPEDKPSSSFNCAVYPPNTPPTLSSLMGKLPKFNRPHFRVRVESPKGHEYYDITDESDLLPVTTTEDIDILTCPPPPNPKSVKGIVRGLKGLTKQNDGAQTKRTYRVLILKVLELGRVVGADPLHDYGTPQSDPNRSWDEIDQRWIPSKARRQSAPIFGSAPPPATLPKVKTNKEIEKSQREAVNELRKRTSAAEDEQTLMDAARVKLDPKIKSWSTEHNKIKHLRTLLSTLHLILWKGAKWKPLSLGELLDDSKLKRYYFKASLVVHPDKVRELGVEEKFIAARVFDALTMAKEKAGV